MTYHLFDSPRLALFIAVLAEIILYAAWMFTHGRLKKRYLLIGPLLAGMSLLLDLTVETNREALERLTRTIVQAAEEENAPAIIDHLSDNFFDFNGLDKDRTSGRIETWLARPLISTNRINQLQVLTAQDDTGTVEFHVTTVLDPKNPYAAYPPIVKTVWRFEFIRDPDGAYAVARIAPIGGDMDPSQLLRYLP